MNHHYRPTLPRRGAKSPTPTCVVCPCRQGYLYDVTSRLAQSLGVKHVRCSACGQGWAISFRPEAADAERHN